MKIKDKSQGYNLIGKFSELLQPELDTAVIHDIKLYTYKKEIARYSSERMEQVEAHFYRNSEFVLAMLQAMLPVNARYHPCTDIIHAISDSNVLDNKQMTDFLQTMTDTYNQEHDITIPQFKELNLRYKEFQKEASPPLNINSESLNKRLKLSFIEILENSPEDIRQKLLGDLLHMHVNRLFTTHQQTHEMVLYNFLLLEYKSRQSKQRAEAS